MLALQVAALLYVVSHVCGRMVIGDANYYYKVLRLANTNTRHFIESRTPSLNRNCFFSPVQCMLANRVVITNNGSYYLCG
ncbi:hypothetical protein KIN20_034828 [Parelaphostrongylus tenuis]|uniref:Secreted protein n=1 Tax=Parelaphostrongylus tenuis TaxID=148309 RepID=A0AAD5RD90_PARTN|nr:hypothetical protein KIN20_034828 [Parelaphostrongylus tenuis]